MTGLRGGATDWKSDLLSRGREVQLTVEARLCITTLGKLFTPVYPSHQTVYNLVPDNGRWRTAAGKVTVGLASHWSWCITDFRGLSTHKLKAYETKISRPSPLLYEGAWCPPLLYLDPLLVVW